MLKGAKELWLALATAVVITILYALITAATRTIPPAGELYGHTLGIIGFVLMLMTETLYSLRKRSRTRVARWGRMSEWLQFHIYTGIVGPYMVLLHSSWKFNGLAGATMLLTVVIVISGFIGRYIYTRIPRTLDGIEVETTGGAVQAAGLAQSRRLMALWHTIHIPIGMALFIAAFVHIAAAIYYATLLK
jgi:hypothetical protein